LLSAFWIAVVAIYIDCHQRLSKSYPNVPRQFWASGRVFVLALVCAALAAIAYLTTNPEGTSYIDKLLTLNIANPYSRAFYVGTLVLVLIRSKLFQVQGVDVGGEYFYNRGREKALNSVILHWLDWRDAFVAQNLDRTFSIPDFDVSMLDRMKAIAAQAVDAEYRANVEAQIRQIESAKPPTAVDNADPAWRIYHRTVTRMTLEVCGRQPFKGLNFQFP
jgi:hypothetical protein